MKRRRGARATEGAREEEAGERTATYSTARDVAPGIKAGKKNETKEPERKANALFNQNLVPGDVVKGSAQAVKFPVGASVSISLELIDRKLVKEANLEQALVRKEQVRGEILEVVNRSRILHFPEHPILGQLKISSKKLQGTTILGAHTKVDSPTTAESSPGYHLFLCKNHYRQNHYPTNLNIPRLLRKGGVFFYH